jgi:hypothetical protein
VRENVCARVGGTGRGIGAQWCLWLDCKMNCLGDAGKLIENMYCLRAGGFWKQAGSLLSVDCHVC